MGCRQLITGTGLPEKAIRDLAVRGRVPEERCVRTCTCIGGARWRIASRATTGWAVTVREVSVVSCGCPYSLAASEERAIGRLAE